MPLIHLTGELPAAAVGSETDGFVSKEFGLVAVFARPGLQHAAEGIRVGSTLAELGTVYEAGESESGWFRVPLGGGREYEFGIGSDDTVESLSIRLSGRIASGIHARPSATWAASAPICELRGRLGPR